MRRNDLNSVASCIWGSTNIHCSSENILCTCHVKVIKNSYKKKQWRPPSKKIEGRKEEKT
jgi:hypothetical protein